MAERKSVSTEPILDNSAVNADPDLEKSKVVYALNKRQYSSLIHQVQTIDQEGVQSVLNVTVPKLKELGIDPNPTAPHTNKAKGSDQFDPGTFIAWVRGIQADDNESINQLQGIDATAKLRFKG